MSIAKSELVWRRPVEVSNLSTNGGRMTHLPVITGVKNNVFSDVSQAERTAGSTTYRKLFLHVANDADLSLIAPRLFIEKITPGDDAIYFFPATQRDTQATIVGTEQKYGAGTLVTTVSPGATQIVVDMELSSVDVFPEDGKIRISDKETVNSTGNEDIRVIDTVSLNGARATITLTQALTNGYSNSNTIVSLVYEPSDVSAVISNFSKTSSQGTFDDTNYPVVGDSISSIEQDWVATFTSATAYTLTGDVVGQLAGSYNIASDATPLNANYGKPYFIIPALAFGGTWAQGDSFTFRTSPASIPLWFMRKIPAGAGTISGNSAMVAIEGESS